MNLLSQLGSASAVLLIAAFLARPFIVLWLNERIRAGVEETVKRRLAELQLSLDKDLEKHKAQLQVAADHIRASLAKEGSDFAIYAQRRHDAVSGLFAELLKAEVDLSRDLIPSDPERSADDGMLQRVMRSRALAESAYYRYALYLPEDLGAMTRDFMKIFDALAVECLIRALSGVDRGKYRDMIRECLLNLERAARAELSRARDPDQTIPSTIPQARKNNEGQTA